METFFSLSFRLVRILLVDDFEPWRRSICSMLNACQQLRVVAEARDGLEALQKAEQLQPDLILLDIHLPNLTGIEAANQINQVAPRAKIIFVTQNNDADLIRAALSTGAGYVWKGDAGRDLLPAIEAALRDEQFVSARLKGGVVRSS